MRVVRTVVVDELLDLASDPDAAVEARAAAEWGLRRALEAATTVGGAAGPTERAHRRQAAAAIERFLERDWAGSERSEALRGPGWARDGSGGS